MLGQQLSKRLFGIIFVILITCLFGCGESGLSKGKAKDVIETHIKDLYGLFLPQKVEFMGGTINSYKFILTAKSMGLIDANPTSSILGSLGIKSSIDKPKLGDVYSITLTEKGNSTKHLYSENGRICFLLGQRKVDDIVEIKKGDNDQYTVLFSYIFKYNELGKEFFSLVKTKGSEVNNPNWTMSDDNPKLRGKAIIVYDSFLKKYVAKSMMWSKWEKENWLPLSWNTYDNDKQVVVSK